MMYQRVLIKHTQMLPRTPSAARRGSSSTSENFARTRTESSHLYVREVDAQIACPAQDPIRVSRPPDRSDKASFGHSHTETSP